MSTATPITDVGAEDAISRRRLKTVVGCSFLTGMAGSGFATILPLHATKILKLDAASFSRVLSLRMAGITFGIILMGAMSDRFGARRVALWAMVVGGLSLALLCAVPMAGFLVLVPVTSAIMSTCYVNLNHLTQLVGDRRQGLANTLYRAAGTSAGILTPFAITHFAPVTWVMLVIGISLASGALLLRGYPIDESPQRFGGWKNECRSMIELYRGGLSHRPLMLFLCLVLSLLSFAASIDAFGAILLTQELGAPSQAYGNVMSIGAGLTLVVILSLGTLLDHWSLKRSLFFLFGLCIAALLGLGFCRSVLTVQICLIAATVSVGALQAPLSMWISRAAGEISLSSAFAIHKVLSAAFFGVAALLMGALEPWIRIRGVFIGCGVLSVLTIILLAWLPEPPRRVVRID